MRVIFPIDSLYRSSSEKPPFPKTFSPFTISPPKRHQQQKRASNHRAVRHAQRHPLPTTRGRQMVVPQHTIYRKCTMYKVFTLYKLYTMYNVYIMLKVYTVYRVYTMYKVNTITGCIYYVLSIYPIRGLYSIHGIYLILGICFIHGIYPYIGKRL